MPANNKWKDEYSSGRPMSDLELVLHKLHERQMWVLVRTLVVSCDEKPQLREVNEALKGLMKWNPSLRMGIRRNTDGKFELFEETEAKPRLECYYNEEDWKKVMEDGMLHPIENLRAPQFRCVYLPNAKYTGEKGHDVCAFVFSFNHGFIDGMSTIATLRKFRLLLNEAVSKQPLSIAAWPKMNPPLEYYYERAIEKLPHEKKKALDEIPRMTMADAFIAKACLYTERRGEEAKKNASIPAKTCLTIKEFQKDEVEKLRLKCRENNATIQGAAQVAGAVALAQMLQTTDDWETLEIKYNLAANLRPYIAQEISVDYTGAYMALLFGFSSAIGKEFNGAGKSKEAFWKLAEESTKMIREQMKNGDYFMYHVAFQDIDVEEDMKFVDDLLKEGKDERRSEELLYTTSYGAWEFPTKNEDAVKPVAVFSNSGIHQIGAIFSQQLISVNGKMSWTIGWSQRVLSQETADEFAKLMFAALNNAVQD